LEFDVVVSPEDYHHANLLHTRLSRRATLLLSGILLALAILAIALHQLGSTAGVLLLITPALVFLIGRTMIRFVFLPGGSLEAYSRQKLLQVAYRYRATEANLSGSSQCGQSALPWDHFVKWKADSQLVLLYTTPSQFMVIPTRCLGSESQQQAFLDLLGRVGVPAA